MLVIEVCAFSLVFVGAYIIAYALITKQYSYAGHRKFKRMKSWDRQQKNMWRAFPIRQLIHIISKFVYLDDSETLRLQRQLAKAEMADTPKEYTAKKYAAILLGAVLSALCLAVKFNLGVILAVLLTAFLLFKLRDEITDKIKVRDTEIAMEMPRFVRTICRNLQNDRDLVRVLSSYRKIAGEALRAELDILLAEMQSGNLENALSHFETRLGTPEAFRLCAALRDMSLGIDQTATLRYLADSMAVEAKENIRRELSLRPAKMRATYYPAIGVCVAMIMYVLIVYVINNLNSIM